MSGIEVRMGRAGSGKSTRILDDICELAGRDPFGAPIWWIVPDNAAFATERMLLGRLPATARVEVVTLRRLAERAMQSAAERLAMEPGGASRRPLNQTGKRMMMLDVYRALHADLWLLRREEPSIRYLDAVLMAMDEMDRHQFVADDLVNARMALGEYDGAASHRKALQSAVIRAAELLQVKHHVDERLAELGFWDSAAVYRTVLPELAQWPELSNASVFLDGFAALSPQEIAFVVRLAECADRCVVALSMDAADAPVQHAGRRWMHGDPYGPQVLRLASEIQGMAADRNVPVSWSETRPKSPQPSVHDVNPRFAAAPSLGHLEKHLFSHRVIPYAGSDAASSVHIAAAQNPRVEIAGLIREIRRGVASGRVRYRDVAVIVPNFEAYCDDLRAALRDAGIPHTADDFPRFSTHPLARFLTAALDVAEQGLTLDSMLRVLKTEFPGVSRDEADWLEGYVRTYEVDSRGGWQADEPWLFASASADSDAMARLRAREDERADALRRRVIAPWLTFRKHWDAEPLSADAIGQALWTLLENVGARALVAKWMVNEDASLSPLEASLHEQAWEFVIGLFEDCVSASPNSTLSSQSAVALIRSAIDECVLSTIPGSVDAVLVTDARRVGGWECEMVFVIGAADGVFPTRVQPVGVWLDEERIAMRTACGKRIGVTTDERQWEERLTVYQCLTRAKRELWVTYPLSGVDGKARRPATVVDRLKRMFGDAGVAEELWTTNFDATLTHGDVDAWDPDSALAWVGKSLQRDRHRNPEQEKTLTVVMDWICADQRHRNRLARVLRGLKQRATADLLPPTIAAPLYRGLASVNVSQLETFAACPYQHFARYGLRLSDGALSNPAPAARGTFLHDVLHAFVHRLMPEMETWRNMSDESAMAAMHEVTQDVLNQPRFESWQRRATRARVLHGARRVLEQAAIVLTEHARHSAFEPRLLEFAFDGEIQLDDGLDVSLPGGRALRMRGRVDRVDVASEDGRHAFRIVDYKSSQLTLDLTQVRHGLQLQLPVYAAMIAKLSEGLFGQASEPAGILYLPVLRRVASVPVPEERESALEVSRRNMRARGLMKADPTLIQWMDERLVDGRDTRLFAKVYTKDGTVAKRAPVLDGQTWDSLLDYSLQKASAMAQQVSDGNIDVAPYRFANGEHACLTCDFRALCHIDPRNDQSPFRFLDTAADIKAWFEQPEVKQP